MSRLSKCQGYVLINYLFYGRFTGRFVVLKQSAQFFVLRHTRRWERTTLMGPKLRPKLLVFNFPIRSHGLRLNSFLSVNKITCIHLLLSRTYTDVDFGAGCHCCFTHVHRCRFWLTSCQCLDILITVINDLEFGMLIC